jgi:hypothetical protein
VPPVSIPGAHMALLHTNRNSNGLSLNNIRCYILPRNHLNDLNQEFVLAPRVRVEPENLLNIAAEAAKGREQSCIAFLAPSQSQQNFVLYTSFIYVCCQEQEQELFSEKKETVVSLVRDSVIQSVILI